MGSIGLGARLARLTVMAVSWRALVACQNAGPFLHTEQYVVEGGRAEERVGVACSSLEKGNGFGGGRAPAVPGAGGDGATASGPSYSFVYESSGSRMTLIVEDEQGARLAQKIYDRAFVESGRKDELKLDVAPGESVRFLAWGVPECGSSN
ncbi:MAG TPA: hypothetical protein VEQ58_02350 [Polyangiaceae bacterium]|nr:hypothetical protein [Polyangiaceae bacterium]